MTETEPTTKQAALARALRRVLRPLARLMIREGLTLPTAVALLKETLVEMAEREGALPGRRLTDSRVSLITGVHRRDVAALRRDRRPAPDYGARPLQATVIGRWLGDPAFRGADGRPASLFRRAADGAPSFEALTQGISQDLRPRTVLDELARMGAVTPDPDDPRRVRLEVEALAPSGDEAAALDFFGANLGDHAEAATRNLAAGRDEPRFLERAVFYNQLGEETVAAIEAEARATATRLLYALNERALAAQGADRASGKALHRIRFGVYFFSEEAETTPAADAPGAGTETDG